MIEMCQIYRSGSPQSQTPRSTIENVPSYFVSIGGLKVPSLEDLMLGHYLADVRDLTGLNLARKGPRWYF
jgi:hypothetical protein